MAVANEKPCTACSRVLPFDCYAPSKQGRFGLKSECVECTRARDAAYRAGRREALRAYKREWRKTSPKAPNERACPSQEPALVRERALKWARDNPARANSRNAKRRASALRAMPSWADPAAIAEIYQRARDISVATGAPWHADHVVPLQSEIVCGLHCEANLQVIPGPENCSKKNRYWPDMP